MLIIRIESMNFLKKLKTNGYIIVDNFFPESICEFLRQKALATTSFNTQYFSYKAIEFDLPWTQHSLKNISDNFVRPKISVPKKLKYISSWCFVHDNIGTGVRAHADPSSINVNVWVTPDKCVEDPKKNGLKVYKKTAPKDTDWHTYNCRREVIDNYLVGAKYDTVPYKCNRATVLRGEFFHATDDVHMKPGHENKRINYTFLYQ